MKLLDTPGYREALQREELIRNSSFADVTQDLCGFEVRPMLFDDFMVFRTLRSPFLVGGEPSIGDVRAFLWRLSPDYDPCGGWNRWKFMRRCRAFLPPLEPLIKTNRSMARWANNTLAALERLGQLMKAIRGYVEDSLQDWGSTRSNSIESISYFSDGVAIIGMIAREYGWSRNDIAKLQMKEVLQFAKEIRKSHGEKIMFNRSDRVLMDYMKEKNSVSNS